MSDDEQVRSQKEGQRQTPPASLTRQGEQSSEKSRKEYKRQKYEAKQARQEQERAKKEEQLQWIRQNSHFCTQVTVKDVVEIKNKTKQRPSRIGENKTQKASLENLLSPYLDLKDGKQLYNCGDKKQLFVAEGTETVRLLIQHCAKRFIADGGIDGSERPPIQVLSILVKPTLLFDQPVMLLKNVKDAAGNNEAVMDYSNDESANGEMKQGKLEAPPFHVLVASEEALSECAGFHISRGALACGVVPQRTEEWLESYLLQKQSIQTHENQQGAFPIRILALDGISDTANMGSMIRCSAAFGVDVMVLSSDSCDAWYRRSVRVSMGHIFNVPIVRVKDLSSTICKLSAEHNVTSFAAVVSCAEKDKELVLLENIKAGDVPERWCCVVGNEANGISPQVIRACTHPIRIDMVSGVDSLSVPIATGVLLHGLKERESRHR